MSASSLPPLSPLATRPYPSQQASSTTALPPLPAPSLQTPTYATPSLQQLQGQSIQQAASQLEALTRAPQTSAQPHSPSQFPTMGLVQPSIPRPPIPKPASASTLPTPAEVTNNTSVPEEANTSAAPSNDAKEGAPAAGTPANSATSSAPPATVPDEVYAAQAGDQIAGLVDDKVTELLRDNPKLARNLQKVDSWQDIEALMKDPNSALNDWKRTLNDSRIFRWARRPIRWMGKTVIYFLPQDIKEPSRTSLKWFTSAPSRRTKPKENDFEDEQPPLRGSSSRSSASGMNDNFDSTFDSGGDSPFSTRSRRPSSSSSFPSSRSSGDFLDDLDSSFDDLPPIRKKEPSRSSSSPLDDDFLG